MNSITQIVNAYWSRKLHYDDAVRALRALSLTPDEARTTLISWSK